MLSEIVVLVDSKKRENRTHFMCLTCDSHRLTIRLLDA